jgi:hypothetical protein
LFFKGYFKLVKLSPTRRNAREHAPLAPAQGAGSTEFSTDFVDKEETDSMSVSCGFFRRKTLSNVL